MSDKFYKTTITVTVLSEGPFVFDGDLNALTEAIDTGDCVGEANETSSVELTGKEMADACYDLRSEPGFFGLDDNGNKIDE